MQPLEVIAVAASATLHISGRDDRHRRSHSKTPVPHMTWHERHVGEGRFACSIVTRDEQVSRRWPGLVLTTQSGGQLDALVPINDC